MTLVALFLHALFVKLMASPETTGAVVVDKQDTPLARARALKAPNPKSVLGGEYEDHEFWETHQTLLSEARKEWGYRHPELFEMNPQAFEARFVNSAFRHAIRDAVSNPSPGTEEKVRALCQETGAPGVYTFRLFTKEFNEMLLEELDHQQASGIPMRRPNGMNRYGAILSELGMGPLLDQLVDRYFRLLAVLLFPSSAGPHDIEENFSFVVRYKEGEDVALAEHADASTVTVNLCLGKESFQGGSLYYKGVRFSDTADQEERNEIEMEPGMAVIHLGGHIHAAQPLTGGERINMIVWMFGKDGYVRTAPYSEQETSGFQLSRWQQQSEL